MYVHPVVLQLESALASDSLRTLCRVLAGASGKITPGPDNLDRTKKPIMDASLTVRAFLRFVELRHGASDDLLPSDFAGKCGSGVRVLLRKCREHNSEVFAALQTRVDDVVKMIRAFYDQTALLNKFLPFFRTMIEAATPAILARKREPLPRLISFLEAYGDIQLTFLYDAAQLRTFSSRLDDLETAQLLETTQSWIQKAKRGQLASIMANKVRTLALTVALLDIELSPQQRTEWAANAVWAAMPEMSQMMERMEVRLREGMLERADPGELFGLTAQLSAEGVETRELFELLTRLLRQAFAEAGPDRAGEVLGEVESRPPQPYHEFVVEALGDISMRFAEEASAEQLEHLLELWVERSFVLEECPRGMAEVLLERGAEGLPPGPTARSGKHLSGLGVDDQALAPLVEKLLEQPRGWALDSLENWGRSNIGKVLELLGEHLWPRPEAPPPRLPEAEAVLRLVGPKRTPLRGADEAAGRLVGTLASQLPGRAEQVESAVIAWSEAGRSEAGGGERVRLSAVVAPLLLEEARESSPEAGQEGEGHLGRSAALLSRALRTEPLGLRSAEWALSPFAGAGKSDIATALTAVAAACGAGGASEEVIKVAASRWLDEESPPAGLGRHVVEAALKAWEEQGTGGAGLDTLRKVHSWLSAEMEGLLAKSSVEPSELCKVLLQLSTLLNAMDGEAPSMAELKRAREGALSKLGLAGRVAFADAVANAWSSALPGVTPGLAAAQFELYGSHRTDGRSVVEALVSGAIEELKWQSRLRLQATFGRTLPPGMQGPPAWRVEGKRKVPWFVHEDVVAEAYGSKGDENLAARGSEKSDVVKNVNMKEKAKNITGGTCMYCGSPHDLGARLVFPLELGGQKLESNLGAVCPLCLDMLHRLGPRRWGEVLLEKPEKAAEVWWEAQKKANMKTLEFLNTKQDAPVDLRPGS